MTSETHTLVFHGEILPGHDPAQARAALAKLLGLPVQDCAHVFSGQRVVLKRDVAPAEIGRYVAHLEKLGIRAAVESASTNRAATSVPSLPAAPVALVAPVPAPAAVVPAPSAVEEVTCPKCGERQPKRTLCRACATDMPRFRVAQQEAAAEALAAKQDAVAIAARGGPAADDSDEAAWIGVNFEGRMGRLAYLFAGLLATALLAVGLAAAIKSHNAVLGVGVTVAVLVVSLRIVALRFHDIGSSGWWALVVAIPYVGPVASLILLLFPGDSGDNIYGPPPRRVGLPGVAVGIGSLVLSIALANSFMRDAASLLAQYGGERQEELAEEATGTDFENVRFAASNRVVFYAVPNCPCVAVRDGLQNMGVSAELRIIDHLSSDEQDALHDRVVKSGLPVNPTPLPLVDVNGVLLADPPPEVIVAKLRIER